MRNLVHFLVRNAHWWLFLLLVFCSLVMIVNRGTFQRSIYLSSANVVTGQVYQISSSVTSYIKLKSVNTILMDELAKKEARIQYLEAHIKDSNDSIKTQAILEDTLNISNYSFLTAHVINNSISQADNYITLDKGAADGVALDMGVISASGVVGIICLVSEHLSIVLPILNTKFILSCKTYRDNHFGPLVWDGNDPRYAWLNKQPRHASFEVGDTIVTSGHSHIFPPGIMVGRAVDSRKDDDDNYYSLRVNLATDFYSLKDVIIVKSKHQEEQKALQKALEESLKTK